MADDEKRRSAHHSTVVIEDELKHERFGHGKHAKPADEKTSGVEKAAEEANVATPPVDFTALFRFSTPFELALDVIGLVAAAAAGAAQPLMSLIFGGLTQDFVDFAIAIRTGNGVEAARRTFEDNAAKNALYLVVIGIGIFICTFVYMYFWIYTGEVNSKRIRERYLQAVLRQDIAYFDNLGPGEVATRIQTDTHLVQQGISEKIPLIISYLAAFFTGFTLAYIRSWRLALAISAILPCIAIVGGIINKFVSTYMQLSLQAVSASGGTLAEEAISTIRTAHAFGTQMTLAGRYNVFISKANGFDNKAAVFQGCGLGVFFFVIYGSYGLAFHFGTTLIIQGHADAGTIVNVFIAILVGSFSLPMLAPEQQPVSQARGAAAKLFQTIDRVPTIDSLSNGGLKPENTGPGKIELRDVKFAYPSRPDVRTLKDLTLTFEAGKTAALVGASGSGKSTIIALIERFYDPLSGNVLFDGVDLKHCVA